MKTGEEKRDIIHEADLVREMMKSEGMKLMRRKMADRMVQIRKRWFQAPTAEAAELARQEAKQIDLFFNTAKSVLAQGEMAKRAIDPPPERDKE